jgi:hypothetical protein
MALGLAQALTDINTRNLLGGKARSAHKADYLTAISQPPQPVTGTALYSFFYVDQTGYEATPASYLMGTGGSLSWGKAAGT